MLVSWSGLLIEGPAPCDEYGIVRGESSEGAGMSSGDVGSLQAGGTVEYFTPAPPEAAFFKLDQSLSGAGMRDLFPLIVGM